MSSVRCANCATLFDSDEDDLCPGCGYGVEAVGIDEFGTGAGISFGSGAADWLETDDDDEAEDD